MRDALWVPDFLVQILQIDKSTKCPKNGVFGTLSGGFGSKLRQWPAPKHLMARLALAIAALLCAGTAASSSLPDPGTVLSPFAIISPDDAKAKCDNNTNINDAVVSLLKSKSLTKVACPFGVPVVGHKDFPTGYVLYAANVLARLLDKNQDGAVDDAAVLKGLKTDYKTIAIGGISQATEDVPMDDDWITFGLQVWKGPDDVVVAKRILVEEIFHMVTQWGWGIAYPSDVGSNDFTTSIACREMARVACSNPGWMHPENRCPGAVGSADDYSFPAGHTYRVPGSSDNLAPVYPITREILPKLQGSVLQLGV